MITSMSKSRLTRRPQAVLFDWDNTIVDTHHVILDAVNKTLNDLGKPAIGNYLNNLERISYFRDLFGDDWEKAYLILKFHLKEESHHKLIVFPEVIEVLKYLREKGIFVGVVSNKFGELLRDEVQYLKLNHYFDVIVGSGDTDQDKPSPKPLLHSLKSAEIQINQENVYFIGDGLVDMQCAQKAGVTGIIYRTTNMSGFDNIVINNYRELIDILDNKR